MPTRYNYPTSSTSNIYSTLHTLSLVETVDDDLDMTSSEDFDLYTSDESDVNSSTRQIQQTRPLQRTLSRSQRSRKPLQIFMNDVSRISYDNKMSLQENVEILFSAAKTFFDSIRESHYLYQTTADRSPPQQLTTTFLTDTSTFTYSTDSNTTSTASKMSLSSTTTTKTYATELNIKSQIKHTRKSFHIHNVSTIPSCTPLLSYKNVESSIASAINNVRSYSEVFTHSSSNLPSNKRLKPSSYQLTLEPIVEEVITQLPTLPPTVVYHNQIPIEITSTISQQPTSSTKTPGVLIYDCNTTNLSTTSSQYTSFLAPTCSIVDNISVDHLHLPDKHFDNINDIREVLKSDTFSNTYICNTSKVQFLELRSELKPNVTIVQMLDPHHQNMTDDDVYFWLTPKTTMFGETPQIIDTSLLYWDSFKFWNDDLVTWNLKGQRLLTPSFTDEMKSFEKPVLPTSVRLDPNALANVLYISASTINANTEQHIVDLISHFEPQNKSSLRPCRVFVGITQAATTASKYVQRFTEKLKLQWLTPVRFVYTKNASEYTKMLDKLGVTHVVEERYGYLKKAICDDTFIRRCYYLSKQPIAQKMNMTVSLNVKHGKM